ncbi:hypothetical protein ABZU32_21350 [Sphaerisporangium sp. NPDC005288]|uniref:hypothetical protein n=1 Tax=Sphaerisporangium sp. NPDC005288 TaxID=3155114 RepID=UPI00339EE2D4
MTEFEPDGLLRDVEALRRRARSDRHAFRLPLLYFGAFTLGTAPLYALAYAAHTPPEDGSADGVTTGFTSWLLARETWLDLVWLAGLAAGAVLTVWWYRRHGDSAGIQTSARGPATTWAVAGVAPLIWFLAPLVSLFVWFLWPLFVRNTFGLLALAFGLIALARTERSRHLWIVTLLYTAAAAPAVVYDMQNMYYRLFHLFGFTPETMPYGPLQGSPVLLPGLILLVGGLAARKESRA